MVSYLHAVSSHFFHWPEKKGSNDPQAYLLNAVKKGEVEEVNALLVESPLCVNDLIKGEVLLSVAIQTGSIPMIQSLIQRGAVNLTDSEGMTPLDYAFLSPQSKEIVPMVIGAMTVQNQEKISSIFNDAPMMRLAKTTSALIRERVANPSLLSYSLAYCQLLHSYDRLLTMPGVIKGELAECEKEAIQLWERQFVSSLDSFGNTGLHFLAADQSEKAHTILARMMQAVEVNVKNHDSQTPLHIACATRAEKNIELLMAGKGDVFQVDNHNLSSMALFTATIKPKDPLELDRYCALVAAFVVASGFMRYALTQEHSQYLIAGLVTVPDLLSYGHLLLPLLATKTPVQGLISILGMMYFFDLKIGAPLLRLVGLYKAKSAIKKAFAAMQTAWKHKSWQTQRAFKALRNGCVHLINLGDSAYRVADAINEIATFSWHRQLSSGLDHLQADYNKLFALHRQEEQTLSDYDLAKTILQCGNQTQANTDVICAEVTDVLGEESTRIDRIMIALSNITDQKSDYSCHTQVDEKCQQLKDSEQAIHRYRAATTKKIHSYRLASKLFKCDQQDFEGGSEERCEAINEEMEREIYPRYEAYEADITKNLENQNWHRELMNHTFLGHLWREETMWGGVPSEVVADKKLLSVDENLYQQDPLKAIKKAYKAYSLLWHPDKCFKPECEQFFLQGEGAYKRLLQHVKDTSKL